MHPIARKLVTNEAMQVVAIQIDYADWLKIEPLFNENGVMSLTEKRQLTPEQQAARQRSLERMKRGYPLGIAGMKREQFYD